MTLLTPRRTFHLAKPLRQNAGIWSDFSKRSESLRIPSERIRKYILEGGDNKDNITLNGPPSLKRKFSRLKYKSPEFIDDAFQTSYLYLQEKAKIYYEKSLQDTELSPEGKEKYEILTDINNPEVQYNFQFHNKLENNPKFINYELPVYRELGKKHWESYSQMLLMQRLETLQVIPDTMPTLVPRMEVNIKFPISTSVNKWIEPGESLSSNVTSFEPIFKLQEYDSLDIENQKYTILIVNPDEPDLENDTFKTSLCYGLMNIQISYNDNIVDLRKLKGKENILMSYLPPVPEKNVGKQRFAVWVFRQENEFTELPSIPGRDRFNIRDFVEENKLDPVGAHVWRSEWDSNVKNIRELYGLPTGRVFTRTRTI
ncbi:mitochondrial 54S ribosomal protein mL38 NDAI_0C04360 [Naumovozyma dairenensis CBS 421]|uniref:Large ribosomal subunit protein mL38 n=1 Tax=Naumovozyma dairenensis (strain ATCC 10597 / BCRC 20456 / CBS 421 / NBRC 0211 / NRRL Y-12639) TaxID=1071378 RepID=G0W8I5_NAUDC|nr:hypothetical protein NDAI_0C04360 [Naumovozyma dairenensis CBS 421]CCD24096.1 hypothetical protein NDAI_0C04360 [Naumovozyma dairenensis CBS 421]